MKKARKTSKKDARPTREVINEEKREDFTAECQSFEEKENVLPTSPDNSTRDDGRTPTTKRHDAAQSSSSPTVTDFTPPALSDVRELFTRRGFKSNPEEFYNFYESKGWLVGQSPMRNWEASAANWEIKVVRERMNGKSTATQQVNKAPDIEKPRAGSFDVHDAFKKALERSYGGYYDDEDEEDEEI